MLELLKIYSCTTITPELYNYRIFDSQNLRLWLINAKIRLLLILDG